MTKPRCPRCHVPGAYRTSKAPDGRPLFACQCGKRWTQGRDGGAFVAAGPIEAGQAVALNADGTVSGIPTEKEGQP